jgi:alkylhydroperoxidase family enzyme
MRSATLRMSSTPSVERSDSSSRCKSRVRRNSERAALALAEATPLPDAIAQESACEAARHVLTDDQISAVIWVAVIINAFNRVSIMSKHPVRADRGAPGEESGVTVSGG